MEKHGFYQGYYCFIAPFTLRQVGFTPFFAAFASK
jgi:hypothetical protein